MLPQGTGLSAIWHNMYEFLNYLLKAQQQLRRAPFMIFCFWTHKTVYYSLKLICTFQLSLNFKMYPDSPDAQRQSWSWSASIQHKSMFVRNRILKMVTNDPFSLPTAAIISTPSVYFLSLSWPRPQCHSRHS